jgi:hypothetical protein
LISAPVEGIEAIWRKINPAEAMRAKPLQAEVTKGARVLPEAKTTP